MSQALLQQENLKMDTPRKFSTFTNFCRRMWTNKTASISFLVLILIILMAVCAPLITSFEPNKGVISEVLQKPSDLHLLGTDELGRDIFTRLIYGARISLAVAFITVTISLIVGITLGMVAGYFSGWIDHIIMRFTDILMAFPGILLAIILMSVLGRGVENAILAITIISIPGYVRIVRGSVLSAKENEYVQSVRAIGGKNGYIMFRHILPNIMAPIIVSATMSISTVILETAALGFLGLGVQPPAAEWGAMLANGKNYIFNAPHIIIFPGIAISITVLAFNLFGDGLRDVLDPRLNR